MRTKPVSEFKLAVVFNVLCSSHEKVARLLTSLSRIGQIRPDQVVVRTRGEFAHLAEPQVAKLAKEADLRITVLTGSTLLPWRSETLSDLRQHTSAELVLLLQEDHWLVDVNELKSILRSKAQFDYCPLTFFPQNQSLRTKIGSLGISKYEGTVTIARFLKPSDAKELRRHFAVSLVGLFKRAYLERMLLAPLRFPFFYDHRTPFVFERKFSDNLVFPITLAYPKSEVFACVDDDNGVAGSSLIARGLAEGLRETSHGGSLFASLSHFQQSILGKLPQQLADPLRIFFGLPIWLLFFFRYRVRGSKQ